MYAYCSVAQTWPSVLIFRTSNSKTQLSCGLYQNKASVQVDFVPNTFVIRGIIITSRWWARTSRIGAQGLSRQPDREMSGEMGYWGEKMVSPAKSSGVDRTLQTMNNKPYCSYIWLGKALTLGGLRYPTLISVMTATAAADENGRISVW